MALEQGVLLHGRYRIEETIAAGGMGAVYRALDESLKIRVAVKENFFTTDDFSRQFRREATILASLRHPNLPRVTDHFVIPGQGQYLVMDFIEGSDLRDLITQKGTLQEGEVVGMGAAICDALTYLHTRNPAIVHRDIKPGNLKISPNGTVYLVDFGLAKVAYGEATATGAQALTPGYAPPEQYGQGTEPRSDIYALGATLYVALTGKIPEDGLSRAMGTAELTPVRKYNPQVSGSLARTIERAMSVRAGDRYDNAESFKQALLLGKPVAQPAFDEVISRPAADPEPGGPGPSSQTERRQQEPVALPEGSGPVFPSVVKSANVPRRKPTGLVPVMGISIVILVLASAGLYWFGGMGSKPLSALPTVPFTSTPAPSVTPPPTQTLPPTQSPTPEPSATALPSPTATLLPPTVTAFPPTAETAPAVPTATATPTSTPAGGGLGQITFASDRGGSVQIWLMNADGSDPKQVTYVADGACQPDWAPDGRRLVFTSPCNGKKEEYARASLFVINADGTGLIPLPSLPGGDFDPAWSPDGQMIAFTSLRDSLPHVFLYSFSDQTTRRVSNPVNRERRPTWSPDGQMIAYETTRQGQTQIWVMALKDGSANEFSSLSAGPVFLPNWSPDGSMIIYSQGTNQPPLMARQTGDKQAKEFLVSNHVRPVEEARFSADSWWITFTSRQNNNMDIYCMLRNGSGLVRLTDSPGLDFHPAWRPAAH